MASTVKKDLRDAVLKIKDGAAAETTVLIGSGNITFTVNTPHEYETDRGLIATGDVRLGEEQPTEVNVTCKWVDVLSNGSEAITPYEALTMTGAASGWLSTGDDDCEPYAVELEVVITPACTAGSPKVTETIKFSEFRTDSCQFDISAGTLVVSGKSKEVAPTVTRP